MTHLKVKTPTFVPNLLSVMDRFMHDDFFTANGQAPAVNIKEKETSYSIEVMAPGLEKSDFSIELENDLLTISYKKSEEKTEETEKFIKREFATRSFSRSFNVNEKLNVENIHAKYENGILIVEIPKAEVKSKEIKTINVN